MINRCYNILKYFCTYIRRKLLSEIKHIKVEGNEDLVEASEVKGLKYSFEYLNPVQSTVFHFRNDDVNLLCASSTSSGKTVVSEICAIDVLRKKKQKVIFLSPLKAVTKEKYDEWTDPSHKFSKYNVSIITGDYKLTEERVEELKQADVILLTSEMLDSRTRLVEFEKNHWLHDVGMIIVDEAHIIGTDGRGDALEAGLMRFSAISPEARLVLLSATIPNAKQASEWLQSLNGKETVLLESSWRPVELNIHFEKHISGREWSYNEVENFKMKSVLSILRKYPDDKFLVFTHTKNTGRQLNYLLSTEEIDADFYNADLPTKQREKLEKSFRNKAKGLRVLLSTSSLAYGMNLPARRVIVVGVHRGLNEVDAMDIVQMMGRAGRLGIDDAGDVYILVPMTDEKRHKDRILSIPPVTSKLLDIPTLAFHMVSEINNKEVRTIEDIHKWFDRSLAKLQGDKLTDKVLDDLISKLESMNMIKRTSSGKFQIRPLGEICSWFYFSPFDVYNLYRNFGTIIQKSLLDNDLALAWALTNTPGNALGYIPKAMASTSDKYVSSLARLGLSIKTQTPTLIAVHKMMKKQKVPPEYFSYSRAFNNDADRLFEVMKTIDAKSGKWRIGKEWKVLELRATKGIPKHLAGLYIIDGIGNKRADKLYEAGFSNVKDIVEDPATARTLIGPKLLTKILEANAV